MIVRFLGIAGIVLLLGCCAWADAILPVNYSFETPLLTPGGYVYRPTGAGWTFTGSAGITSNGGAFNLDAPGDNNAAPDGTQTAFIQYNTDPTSGSLPGYIGQTISGLDATESYTVSFEAAQRPDTLYPTGGFFYGGGLNIQVYWCPSGTNCALLDTVDFASQPATYLDFAEYTTTTTFTGATSGLLYFQADNTQGGDRADFIDSVQLTDPSPEPSNVFLVLSGIGLMGLGMLRRRSLPS